MTEILTFLSSQNYSTKQLFDYWDLLSLNLQIYLDDVEIKKLNEEERAEVNEKIKGWVLYFSPSNKTDFVYIFGNLGDFENTLTHIDNTARKKI